MNQNKIITEHLRVDFTPEELKDKGIALAKTLADLDRLKSEAKAAASAFKSQIDAKSKDSKELANHVNNGYDHFPVQCEARMNDPRPGMKSVYRLDSGDHVETLKMNAEERQLLIDGLSDIQQADAPAHISRHIQLSIEDVERNRQEQEYEDLRAASADAPFSTKKEEDVLQVNAEDAEMDVKEFEERNSAAAETTGPDKPLQDVKVSVIEKPKAASKAKSKKAAKAKPDNVFATRDADWFAARITKEIEAKSPKEFNGLMKIDDQRHADWLLTTAQNDRSYSFRDPAVQK